MAPWFAVGLVCFGAFMGQLDASIVTLTFRPMEHGFHAPLAAVQWVSLSYLLALVALLAPVGRVSDARGRKLVYTAGLALFTVASAACGLAPTLGLLIVLRVVQAAGAAMLQANSVALVATSVPRNTMRFALGVQAAAQSVGLALGPTLGGLLTASVGWRAVYWVNVPVGCIAAVAARNLLPRTRHFSRTERFDWPGSTLLALASTGVLLTLSAAGGLAIPAWSVAALTAGSVTGLVAFAWHENRARCPVIPVGLLRDKGLALGLCSALCGYLVLFGPLVLIPQVLAGLSGHSAAGVGLLLSALPAGFGLSALGAEKLLPRALTNKGRGVFGASVAAAALAMLAMLPVSPGPVVGLLAATGLGLGVCIPATNTAIMRSGQAGSSAVLGGLVNMARGTGTTLGIAMVTLALHLGGAGSELAFIMLAMVALVYALIALATHPPADPDEGCWGQEGAAGALG